MFSWTPHTAHLAQKDQRSVSAAVWNCCSVTCMLRWKGKMFPLCVKPSGRLFMWHCPTTPAFVVAPNKQSCQCQLATVYLALVGKCFSLQIRPTWQTCVQPTKGATENRTCCCLEGDVWWNLTLKSKLCEFSFMEDFWSKPLWCGPLASVWQIYVMYQKTAYSRWTMGWWMSTDIEPVKNESHIVPRKWVG